MSTRDLAKRERALKRYLRKEDPSRYLTAAEVYIYLFGIAAFAMMAESGLVAQSIAGFALAAVLLARRLYIIYMPWRCVVDARREGTNAWLVEDFERARIFFSDRLRVGGTWVFGFGSGSAIKIERIECLRGIKTGWPKPCYELYADLSSGELNVLLCKVGANQVEPAAVGTCALYLSQLNPRLVLSPELQDMVPAGSRAGVRDRIASGFVMGMWGTCFWMIDGEGSLTVKAGEGAPCRGKSPWSDAERLVRSAWLEPGVVLPEDCSGLFAGCFAMSEVLAEWDVSRVRNMKRMFCGCSSLEYLDASG